MTADSAYSNITGIASVTIRNSKLEKTIAPNKHVPLRIRRR